MKKIVLGLCFLVVSSLSQALVIVDQIGDADGFGIGAVDGASFDWTAIGSGDGDGTDRWRHGDFTYSHTYSIAGLGAITSASLEIFTGGQGFHGLTSLLIDGVFVDYLTDGDTWDTPPGQNIAHRDTFDLMSFAHLLDGASTITVDVQRSGDGWALDYSLLVISDEGVAVPEPGSIALLVLGLAGLGLSRRKKIA